MYEPLDGPSAQLKVTLSSGTALEVKVGSQTLEDRKVVSIQPNQDIKVYFGDGVNIPSASTVVNNGLDHYRNQLSTYEAGARQPVFIAISSGSASVVIIERA